MKEHLKFAFKVFIALLIMNAIFSVLGGIGNTLRGLRDAPLSALGGNLGGLLGGGSSSTTAG